MFREMLRQKTREARTENGGAAYSTSGSDCLDLFAAAGALREAEEQEITLRFARAYAENAELAVKMLFFVRDVRGGLGERRTARVMLRWLACSHPADVQRNLPYLAEFGRYDDLLTLLDTPCEDAAVDSIQKQLQADVAALQQGGSVSLLAKWLPSANASSRATVSHARRLAARLGMTERQYRKTTVALRARIDILEDRLRRRDYTFDYEKQPSVAMYKYRKAFARCDGPRYRDYLQRVAGGQAVLHTAALLPYQILTPLLGGTPGADERRSLDTAWNALPDCTRGENALVVVDGSGSMYWGGRPLPASVALSLGLYYAERNRGCFHGCFITFSMRPQLIEVKGRDLAEKVAYCRSFCEAANTDLQRVFEVVLQAAVCSHAPQSELPSTLYVISDMEFDACTGHADETCFENAGKRYARYGYKLPRVVFWNVQSRSRQQPVQQNDQGVALVSGCTPQLFSLVTRGQLTPLACMYDILHSQRYACITV